MQYGDSLIHRVRLYLEYWDEDLLEWFGDGQNGFSCLNVGHKQLLVISNSEKLAACSWKIDSSNWIIMSFSF